MTCSSKGFVAACQKQGGILNRLSLAGASQIQTYKFDWFVDSNYSFRLASAKIFPKSLMGFLENPSQFQWGSWLAPKPSKKINLGAR